MNHIASQIPPCPQPHTESSNVPNREASTQAPSSGKIQASSIRSDSESLASDVNKNELEIVHEEDESTFADDESNGAIEGQLRYSRAELHEGDRRISREVKNILNGTMWDRVPPHPIRDILTHEGWTDDDDWDWSDDSKEKEAA